MLYMASNTDSLVVARTNPAGLERQKMKEKVQMCHTAACQMAQISLCFPCRVSQKVIVLCGHADTISVICR
jgi:hypothetical protein